MATVTLRPDNSYYYSTWNGTGGSPSEILSDNSDATYLSTASGGQYFADVAFTNMTVPALAIVRSVTVRVRWGVQGYDTSTYLTINAITSSGTRAVGTSRFVGHATTYTYGAHTTDPAGAGWTESSVNDLRVSLSTNVCMGAERVYEAYADVVYNEAPVVTVNTPAEGSSLTSTTRPIISWVYSDPDNDPQERYYVKVFSSAQYNAGGFNPSTSTAVWSSGEVFSSVNSVTVPIDLDNNTTYRAYVRVADAGSNGRTSNWDNNTFTVSVTAPPAPSFVVDPQEIIGTDGPKIMLQVTRTSSATPTTYMLIEYSDDGGVTWRQHSSGKIQNVPDGATFTRYDYESPPDRTRKYRARAVRVI